MPGAALLHTYISMPCRAWHPAPSCSSPRVRVGTSPMGTARRCCRHGHPERQQRARGGEAAGSTWEGPAPGSPPLPTRTRARTRILLARMRARAGGALRAAVAALVAAVPRTPALTVAGGCDRRRRRGLCRQAGCQRRRPASGSAGRARECPEAGEWAEGLWQRGWCWLGSAVQGSLDPCWDGERSWAGGAASAEPRARRGRDCPFPMPGSGKGASRLLRGK